MKDVAIEFLKGSRLTEHEPSCPCRLPELPAGCFAMGMLFTARQHRQHREQWAAASRTDTRPAQPSVQLKAHCVPKCLPVFVRSCVIHS